MEQSGKRTMQMTTVVSPNPMISPSNSGSTPTSPPPSKKAAVAAAASSGVETVFRTLFGSCTGTANRDASARAPALAADEFLYLAETSQHTCTTATPSAQNGSRRRMNMVRYRTPCRMEEEDCCGTARAAIVLGEEGDLFTERHRVRFEAADKRVYAAVSSAHRAEEEPHDTALKPWPMGSGNEDMKNIPSLYHRSLGSLEDFDDGISAITAATLEEMARRNALANQASPAVSRHHQEVTAANNVSLGNARQQQLHQLHHHDLPKQPINPHSGILEQQSQSRTHRIMNKTTTYPITPNPEPQPSPPILPSCRTKPKLTPTNPTQRSSLVTPPETPQSSSHHETIPPLPRLQKRTASPEDYEAILKWLNTLKRLVEQRHSWKGMTCLQKYIATPEDYDVIMAQLHTLKRHVEQRNS